MLARLASYLRHRWHPLWRLRQIPAFRRFQRRWDRTVYTRIPGTGLRVAVKFLRDASWLFNPAALEPEIRGAFRQVLDLLKPGTFWDVGANIGFYSWLVRGHPSVRRVVMFEPDPVNYALITQTIRRNAIADCQALNVALSDRPGEAAFVVDHASGAAGSLEATSLREHAHSLQHSYRLDETILCRTATVDELVAAEVPPPDLVKIDVEGAEHLVLAGAGTTLAKFRPTLVIETGNPGVVSLLQAAGYTALRIDSGNLLFVATTHASALATLGRTFAKV